MRQIPTRFVRRWLRTTMLLPDDCHHTLERFESDHKCKVVSSGSCCFSRVRSSLSDLSESVCRNQDVCKLRLRRYFFCARVPSREGTTGRGHRCKSTARMGLLFFRTTVWKSLAGCLDTSEKIAVSALWFGSEGQGIFQKAVEGFDSCWRRKVVCGEAR